MGEDLEAKIKEILPKYRKVILPFASRLDIYSILDPKYPILINDFDQSRLEKAKFDENKQFSVWYREERDIYRLLKKYNSRNNLYLIDVPHDYPTGDQEALADALADIKSKTVLIGSNKPFYSNYLVDWHNEPVKGLNGKERCLWLNFSYSEQMELI